MKVLLIHNGHLGNLLLITPIIRSLASHMEVSVDLLIPASQHGIFADNPYSQQLLDLNEPLFNLHKRLKSEKYDHIIDFQNNLKSKLVSVLIRGRRHVIPKQRFKKWIYSRFKVNLLPNAHLTDQYFERLKSIGLKKDSLGLDFNIPEKDEVENDWLPESHQNGYIALIIHASHQTRKLPINRLIELCDRINKPIILIGDSSDEPIAAEVEEFFKKGTLEQEKEIEELNKKAVIFNACGKFNLNQQASLIKSAAFVFTYDNEWMQIAAAFKKQLFTIWGNTTPNFGGYPYRTQFTVFENNKLDCRPCSSTGFTHCPKGHFKCMNDVTFDFYLPD